MTDEMYDKVENFQKEFKQLVRKYVPVYPSKDGDELLCCLQDKTSCYSPYIWSEED